MQINVAVTDANNIVCEVTPPQPEIIVIDRGVAGNGIVSIVPVTISTFQYLRITYTNGTVQDVGPLTSTAYTATSPITIVGNTISLTTVPIALGGTDATTAAGAIQNLLPSYTGNANKRLGLNSGGTALEWVADGGGTVTSVSGTGSVNGLTLTGTVTSSGSLTLGGTLSNVANSALTNSAITINGTSTSLGGSINVGTVTSVAASGGTTGLTFTGSPITTSGTLTLGGTLAIANGGTGQTTANAALNALLPTQTGNASKYLQTDGTNATWDAISLSTADITGILPTANGGTGLSSFTANGVVYASSTSALTTGSALTFNGTNLTFGSTAQRIIGNTSDVSHANRLMFVNSVTNGNTFLGTLPNGTSTVSGINVYNNSDPTNSSYGSFRVTSAEVQIQSTVLATGTFLPMTFYTNASEQMRLNSTGLGIGTNNPTYKLQVQGYAYADSGFVVLSQASGGGSIYEASGNTGIGIGDSVNALRFTTNAAERARFNSSGQLLINTTTAATTEKLRVVGAGVNGASFAARFSQQNYSAGYATLLGLGVETNAWSKGAIGFVRVTDYDVGDLVFCLNSNASGTTDVSLSDERMRLTAIGNLGIGTTNPTAKLDVTNGASPVSRLRVGVGAGAANTLYSTLSAGDYINFETNGSERARINSSGNFGLGVTPQTWYGGGNLVSQQIGANTAIISLFGTRSVFASNYYLASGTGTDTYIATGYASQYQQESGQHRFFTAPSGTAGNAITFNQAMTLTAGGNLGIGTTSPASALYVKRTSGNSGIYTDYNGTNVGRIEAASNGNLYIGITTGSGDIGIGNTANATALNLASTGNLGLGVFPNAWQTTSYKVFQIGATTSIFNDGGAYTQYINNAYIDSAYAWRYQTTSFATRHDTYNGQQRWFTAPSGTAFNVVTWTQAMTLDADGDLGIGVTSPATKLDVSGGSSADVITIRGRTSDNFGLLSFATSSGTKNAYVGSTDSTNLTFYTNGFNERARIDPSGNLLLGLSSALTNGKLQIAGGIGLSGNTQIRQATNGDGNTLQLFATQVVVGVNNGTSYSYTGGGLLASLANSASAITLDVGGTTAGHRLQVVNDGSGSTGYLNYSNAGTSRFYVNSNDGAVGIGTSSPAEALEISRTANPKIRFLDVGNLDAKIGIVDSTALGFEVNGSERARIASDGKFYLGVTSGIGQYNVRTDARISGTNTYYAQTISATAVADTGGYTTMIGMGVEGNAWSKGAIGYTRTASYDRGYLGFYLNPTADTTTCALADEKMRLDYSGNLLLGTTSQLGVGKVSIAYAGASAWGMAFKTTGQDNSTAIVFRNSSDTSVGSIQTTTSATSYVTSSDYRLKNTIAPMTGALAKVALLKPCTYKWNVDGSDGQGFIAHELADVVPQCVTGEKDAVDADGKPHYQGIDTSFLVATLTAAIQEQQAIIESLKARLDAANL